MQRRLTEDRNQHYDDLDCACWSDKKVMARFKEQPKQWTCYCCSSQRYNPWESKQGKLTMSERKYFIIRYE